MVKGKKIAEEKKTTGMFYRAIIINLNNYL
jgi:hypothetical protein